MGIGLDPMASELGTGGACSPDGGNMLGPVTGVCKLSRVFGESAHAEGDVGWSQEAHDPHLR